METPTNPGEYEGWANRETWAFMLNVNNEQDVQNLAHREVRRCIANGYHPTAVGEHVAKWLYDWLDDLIDESVAFRSEAMRILREVGSWWRIDYAEIGEHFVADVLDIDSVVA